MYGAHARSEIFVFDDLSGYLEEKLTYSRKVDERGEPTEEIEDKSSFHHMDAERYVVSYVKGGAIVPATSSSESAFGSMEDGGFGSFGGVGF